MHQIGTYIWVITGTFLVFALSAIAVFGGVLIHDEMKLRRLLRREGRWP